MWSSANDSKERLVVTTAIRGDKRLVESGENNVEAQQDVQNWKGTKPMQNVTEQHTAQNEEDEGRGEENSDLLKNYYNIDTAEKQTILEKIDELMKKDNLPNPQNLRRIDRVRPNLWTNLKTLCRQVTLLKTTSSSSAGY